MNNTSNNKQAEMALGLIGNTIATMGSGWHSLCSFLGTLCLSITLPYWLLRRLWIYHQYRQSNKKLQDKVVLITGASSGLGEALAHAFYRLGCRVVLAARREDELKRVKEDLLRTHQTVPTHPPVVLPMDVSELNELPKRVEAVLAIHGKVDILVSNAGVSSRGAISDCTVNVDINVMLVNYLGHVALTKALLPSMIERNNGHIVAVSSVQGRIAIPHRAAYSASKHALQAFCDSMRAEVASKNIKVTVVSPGYIKTNLSINAVTGTGQKYAVMDEATAKGMSPDDVAERVVQAVVCEDPEVLVCTVTPQVAILLRAICPSLYFWIMRRRAHTSS